MLTSEKIKEYAKSMGADIVGIASYDRFDGAPKQKDPRYIFPEGKSIIVMGFRHLRGVFRGIEEGTFWTSYCSMGYASINIIQQPLVLWEICKLIEDEGYEAIPIPNTFPWASSHTDIPNLSFSRKVSSDKPHPNIIMHLRIAAFAAGLGDIGYSKMFLSPEFGPAQRLAAIITELPLEPDPMPEERVCDMCKLCVKACTIKAIPPDKTVKIKIAGRDVEWADINIDKCIVGFEGCVREHNPFIVTDEEMQKYTEYTQVGYEEAKSKIQPIYNYARALEGAAGCIRACLIHLEEKGKIKRQFKEPFRKRKPWKL